MLPIQSIRSTLLNAWSHTQRFVITAPTGSGKSTELPQWLTHADFNPTGKTLVLQPRRAAARALAHFVSKAFNDHRVGYQLAGEHKHLKTASLIYMTYGLFLQKLLHDPELEGISCIIIDEFHERKLDSDLSLALLLQCQELLRPDLRIILMSATLDEKSIAHSINAMPLAAQGRSFPVNILYHSLPKLQTYTESQQVLSEAIYQHAKPALLNNESVLVFLTGIRQINQMQTQLLHLDNTLNIQRLHSQIDDQEQQLAIHGNQTPRIVLATNIAESSLTINDLALVIDLGKEKQQQYSSVEHTSVLIERSISQASADQRAGRAGRLKAGQCVRLWSQESPLAPQVLPEVQNSDLRPLLLMLKQWGADALELFWLNAPNQKAIEHAETWLIKNQCLSDNGTITALGESCLQYGCDLGLALMMSQKQDIFSCELAALKHHGAPLADISNHQKLASHAIKKSIKQWSHLINQPPQKAPHQTKHIGNYLSLAMPELIALFEHGKLSSICGRRFTPSHHLKIKLEEKQYYLITQYSQIIVQNKPCLLANEVFSVEYPHITLSLSAYFHTRTHASWQGNTLKLLETALLGDIILTETPKKIDLDGFRLALAQKIQQQGLMALNFDVSGQQLFARITLAQQHIPEFSKYTPAYFTDNIEQWLLPCLQHPSLPSSKELEQWLWNSFDYAQQQVLNTDVPKEITLPTGQTTCIDYLSTPIRFQAKLQALFGWQHSPKIAHNAVVVNADILAPNKRSVALSADLGYFWQQIYPQVRKELRGRYNKHPWPEDPINALATHKTNRQLRD